MPTVLTIQWQPARSRFVFTARVGEESETLVKDYAFRPRPAVGFDYRLWIVSAPNQGCGPHPRPHLFVTVDGRFDNVRLDEAAVAAE